MGVFIVAELSANHAKDLDIAKASLRAIKECGADAVKLQTYSPDSLTLGLKNEVFKIKSNTIWDEKYLYDLYKEAAMPLEWNEILFDYAREIGLICFSSVFDWAGIELLERLHNPIYKIASFELLDLELISRVARTKKPIILSSGIAIDDEINLALNCIRAESGAEITILECASAYPADICDINFARMQSYANLGVKFGLSDHTLGNNAALIAQNLGASVIEKHFILDKSIESPDSKFSLDRWEFGEFVAAIRQREINIAQMPKGREFARSLFVIKDIKKGEILNMQNIRSMRPNAGLHPKFLHKILGKRAAADLALGKPLNWDDIDG